MLKQIGKYTISERIGRGNYSRVYRAVDPQGRRVAIKVSTTRSEPEHLNEFQKDLVAAASVLHPNLVSVHDLGFEDDFPYLVMELVQGHDLDKLLKSNSAPSLAERIRVMQQVGEALKSAHERGVFHLDVRPSKIMLGEDGTAKLLDLGLGRLSFDPARVTENGYLVGAPFYMSPERLTAIDTANARCDIWSFGVTFYEVISGRHPFYDDDGDRMIGNIMDAAPAPLSNVSAPLNQAILRAFEKDPADRYASFAELLAELKPLVSDVKREESDALMAEALKQSDSGRWHEARRIARQLNDLEPQHGPSSQMFGFSEQEREKERLAEQARPVSVPPAAPSMQPLAASASAATAVDTRVPAPPPPPAVVQRPPAPPPSAATQPAAAQPVSFVGATTKPQRPERTTPKIPPMGVRNGASVNSEKSAPEVARVKPPVTVGNGARMTAAAAGAGVSASAIAATVKRETDTAPRVASSRPRPTGNLRITPTLEPSAPPLPTVRILEIDHSGGGRWVKVFSFVAPAILMIAAFLYFLRPTTSLLKSFGSSEEAKEISPAGRVIKADHAEATDLTSQTTGNPQPTVVSSSVPLTNAQLGGPGAIPTTGDPLNGQQVTPKAFDPKSLVLPKVQVPVRRPGNGAMAGVAAPSLGSNGEVTDSGFLPVAMNMPPAPAPAAATHPAAPALPAPTKSSATEQSAQPANNPVARSGGAFAQPVLVRAVQPVYPPAAIQRKTQGIVRFEATIAKDGSVKNIQLVSGDPLLNVAAKQAVLQWLYQPATLNGEPVEVKQAIVVKFNLGN